MLSAVHTANGSEKVIGFDNVTLRLVGDADGNGHLEPADVNAVVGYLLGLPDSVDSEAADITADGTVDINDVVALITMILSLRTGSAPL